jgi:peptide/nickel transport system ATP-binding protein
MTALLEVEDLHVEFPGAASPTVAVNGVSLSVETGELVGIVGESGSGKSVTLSSCLGLTPWPGRVTQGNVAFAGLDVLSASERQLRHVRGRDITMILQDPMTALHPSLTVGRQLDNVRKAGGALGGRQTPMNAVEALTLAGVPDAQQRLRAYPHQLSGGLRQRVMIAMAIIHRPRLLLADEPTTALDVTVQAEILRLLRRLNRETGIAVLIVTHNFGVVAALCERTIVMRRGKVVESGKTSDVFNQPGHHYTRELLEAVPRVDVPAPPRPHALLPEPPAPVLRAERVTRTYRAHRFTGGTAVTALDDVTLDVLSGEVLGVVGESGGGKTTLGRCLMRLTDVSSGRILFRGEDVTQRAGKDLRAFRREVQMVFQDTSSSLDPRWTIRRLIAEPINFHHLRDEHAVDERIEELMDMVGLARHLAERYPRQLSGGERQRAGIARALAVEPSVLIADEPVSALDVAVQAQVIELLMRLQAELRLTVVIISHDLGLVRRLCDRVAVMQAGRLVETGASEAIFTAPGHPYTRALLRSSPSPDPAVAVLPMEDPATDLAAARIA